MMHASNSSGDLHPDRLASKIAHDTIVGPPGPSHQEGPDAQVYELESTALRLNREGVNELQNGRLSMAFDCFVKADQKLKQLETLVARQAGPSIGNVSVQTELQQKRTHLSSVTWNNLGCYYKRVGDLHTALKYLRAALEVMEAAGVDVSSKAGIHLNLSSVLSRGRNHEQALRHSLAALAYYQISLWKQLQASDQSTLRRRNDDIKLLDAYTALGMCYHTVGLHYRAVGNLHQARLAFETGIDLVKDVLPDRGPVVKALEDGRRSIFHSTGTNLRGQSQHHRPQHSAALGASAAASGGRGGLMLKGSMAEVPDPRDHSGHAKLQERERGRRRSAGGAAEIASSSRQKGPSTFAFSSPREVTALGRPTQDDRGGMGGSSSLPSLAPHGRTVPPEDAGSFYVPRTVGVTRQLRVVREPRARPTDAYLTGGPREPDPQLQGDRVEMLRAALKASRQEVDQLMAVLEGERRKPLPLDESRLEELLDSAKSELERWKQEAKVTKAELGRMRVELAQREVSHTVSIMDETGEDRTRRQLFAAYQVVAELEGVRERLLVENEKLRETSAAGQGVLVAPNQAELSAMEEENARLSRELEAQARDLREKWEEVKKREEELAQREKEMKEAAKVEALAEVRAQQAIEDEKRREEERKAQEAKEAEATRAGFFGAISPPQQEEVKPPDEDPGFFNAFGVEEKKEEEKEKEKEQPGGESFFGALLGSAPPDSPQNQGAEGGSKSASRSGSPSRALSRDGKKKKRKKKKTATGDATTESAAAGAAAGGFFGAFGSSSEEEKKATGSSEEEKEKPPSAEGGGFFGAFGGPVPESQEAPKEEETPAPPLEASNPPEEPVAAPAGPSAEEVAERQKELSSLEEQIEARKKELESLEEEAKKAQEEAAAKKEKEAEEAADESPTSPQKAEEKEKDPEGGEDSAKLAEAEKAKADAEKKLKKSEKKRAELENQKAEAEKAKAEAQKEKEAAEASLNEKDQKVTALETEVATLQEKLKEAENAKEKGDQEAQDKGASAAELEQVKKQLEEQTAKTAEFQKAKENEKKARAKVLKELEQSKKATTDAEAKATAAASAQTQAEQERDAAKQEVATLQEKLKAAEKKAADAEKKASDTGQTAAAVEAAEKKAETAEAEKQQLEKDKAALEQQANTLKDEKAKLIEERDKLKEKKKKLQAEFKKLAGTTQKMLAMMGQGNPEASAAAAAMAEGGGGD